MKHVICLAVASLLATSANAAEMKWSGSAGYRYEQTSADDGSGGNIANTRNKAHGYRANLGVSGGWENVEWGVGVRTNRAGSANDDHVFANNGNNFGIGFEQAWFRYVREFGSLDFSVTAGRQRNVFAYDNVSQNLFDNDVRFDGLGWQFKFGMFSLNAAQYTLGGFGTFAATNPNAQGTSNVSVNDALEATPGAQRLTYLFGIQPTMNWKFSDDIEAMFGVGYYYWKDDSNTNTLGGSSLAGSLPGAAAAGAYRIGNPRQWQFTTAVSLPYSLSFNGEFVMNKQSNFNNTSGVAVTASPEVSRSAWSAGLTYGSLKKAHDFSVGYAYGSKGIGSVINRYSHEKFQADNKGHTIRAAYAIADNFHLGARAILTKEIEQLATNGTAKPNQGKNNYWELTGGVMF